MRMFGYVDDLSLLCASFAGIKKMLNISEKYARMYDNCVSIMQSKVNCYTSLTMVIMIMYNQFSACKMARKFLIHVLLHVNVYI